MICLHYYLIDMCLITMLQYFLPVCLNFFSLTFGTNLSKERELSAIHCTETLEWSSWEHIVNTKNLLWSCKCGISNKTAKSDVHEWKKVLCIIICPVHHHLWCNHFPKFHLSISKSYWWHAHEVLCLAASWTCTLLINTPAWCEPFGLVTHLPQTSYYSLLVSF